MLKQRTIRRVRSVLILILDIATALTIFSCVYFVRLESLPNYLSLDLWLIIATLIATLFLSGTYFKDRSYTLPVLPTRTFFVCLAGGALCVLWVYLLGPNQFKHYFGRGVLPAGTLIFGVVATLNRFFLNRLYHLQERGIELLYIGYSPSAAAFINESKNHIEVRGINFIGERDNELPTHLTPIASRLTEDILDRDWGAIIVDPEHEPSEIEKSLLVRARLSGTPILSLSEYYESNWYMVPVNVISDDWFLRSHGFHMLANPMTQRLKRLLDVVLALILIVLSAPVVLLCSIAIKLNSAGPAFFSQTRVGYQGKLFTIYKLRTMRQDAESDGAQWAETDDPRITKVGAFLRKSRLDELPQCWNVLIGDMSFIGPRPERPEFTSLLSEKIPYYELRHTVKPGISGWAQVIFPYGASTEDALKKLQYELYYIKHQSLLLDLNIAIRTLFTVFQGAGR